MYPWGTILASLCFFLQFLAFAEADINSVGCGKALASNLTQGNQSNSLEFTTSNGTRRTYLLHIPGNYNIKNATPLIFSFHGRTRNGEEQETLTGFSEKSGNPDSFAVYPDGINNQWQGDPDAKTNDVGFILELIEALEKDYCIDKSRIYSSGMSNGGGLSVSVLACDEKASVKFAAFAGHSAAIYQEKCDEPLTCNPSRPDVPILEIHGSADDVIPFHGGSRRDRCLPDILTWASQWAERDDMDNSTDKSSSHSGSVVTREFGQKKANGLVTQVWVEGLGHVWASTSTGAPINATLTMLDFFEKYSLPADLLSSNEPNSNGSNSNGSNSDASDPSGSKSSDSSSGDGNSNKSNSNSIAPPGWHSQIALIFGVFCFCVFF